MLDPLSSSVRTQTLSGARRQPPPAQPNDVAASPTEEVSLGNSPAWPGTESLARVGRCLALTTVLSLSGLFLAGCELQMADGSPPMTQTAESRSAAGQALTLPSDARRVELFHEGSPSRDGVYHGAGVFQDDHGNVAFVPELAFGDLSPQDGLGLPALPSLGAGSQARILNRDGCLFIDTPSSSDQVTVCQEGQEFRIEIGDSGDNTVRIRQGTPGVTVFGQAKSIDSRGRNYTMTAEDHVFRDRNLE